MIMPHQDRGMASHSPCFVIEQLSLLGSATFCHFFKPWNQKHPKLNPVSVPSSVTLGTFPSPSGFNFWHVKQENIQLGSL